MKMKLPKQVIDLFTSLIAVPLGIFLLDIFGYPKSIVSYLILTFGLWCLFRSIFPSFWDQIVMKFGKIKWTRDEFCRGHLITGNTGSGKTASAIKRIAHEAYKNFKSWGGIIVDPKCVLWQDFQKISTFASSIYQRQELKFSVVFHFIYLITLTIIR